jgi:nucleoside-diphosphate-sugar epimerase
MKLLVTGATGFIGGHLCGAFRRNGWDITAIVLPREDVTKLHEIGVNTIAFDGDLPGLIDRLKPQEHNGVVHLATCYVAQHVLDDIDRLVDANIRFSLKMLEAAVGSHIPWFLNVGTFWQHFDNAAYSPTNLYAATKQAFMDLATYYLENSELIFTTIKLNDTYGPNDTRPKLFNVWKEIATSGEELDMSPGEQLMDIVHVNDVVSAFLKMIKELEIPTAAEDMAGRSYVVSSGMRLSLRQLAYVFQENANCKLNINWGKRPYRAREVMVPYDQGTPVPGWTPRIDIAQGIRELFNDSVLNGDV